MSRKMPRRGQIFNSVMTPQVRRNAHNLSYESKLTLNMGDLIPIYIQDVIPGTTLVKSTDLLNRVAPLIAPLMHRVDIYLHYFFCPNRLVDENFEDFITQALNGQGEGTVLPQVLSIYNDSPILKAGTLTDYMGLPSSDTYFNGEPAQTPAESVSLLTDAHPFLIYQLIWNEYYRNEFVQDEIDIEPYFSLSTINVDSITNNAIVTIRKHNWEKDYFVSALPNTQIGDSVMVPFYGGVSVQYQSNGNPWLVKNTNGTLISSLNPAPGDGGNLIGLHQQNTQGISNLAIGLGSTTTGAQINFNQPGYDITLDPNGTLRADLDTVQAGVDILDLYRSVALQQYLQISQRAGNRYIEYILAHYNVRSSDARLQRPVFLGGRKLPLSISEVLQTSESTKESPLADMAGHGIAAGSGFDFKAYFEEYGWVIGIMFIKPRSGYMQGLPRMFTRFSPFDYAIPSFQHLGEQEIREQELFYDFTKDSYGIFTPSDTQSTNSNTKLFGYTPRYAEYKYRPDEVHGDFRTTLQFWHMTRVFDTAPSLNSKFLEVENIQRPFALNDDSNKFWVQLYHRVKCIQPLSLYGTPHI